MFSFLSLSFILWLFFQTSFADPCRDSIPLQNNCTACTQVHGCGWAYYSYPNSNRYWGDTYSGCFGGDRTGPGSYPELIGVTIFEWLFSTADCACGLIHNCTLCTEQPNCGWCVGTLYQKSPACLGGTSTGPDIGYTCSTSWDWISSECSASGDSCNAYTNCAACNAQSACGWGQYFEPLTGNNLDFCQTGSINGPTTLRSDGLLLTGWSWLESDCNCDFFDCTSCTEQSVCGWCQTAEGFRNHCRQGTSGGTTDGDCVPPAWDWVHTSCP